MKGTLFFILPVCFVCLLASTTLADNYSIVNDQTVTPTQPLLLELDFSSGVSVEVDITIGSNHPVNVWFIPHDSVGPAMTGGSFFYYSALSDSIVHTFQRRTTLEASEWGNNVFYFFVEALEPYTCSVDVDYHAYVDYDGDGLAGRSDPTPFLNDTWATGIEESLVTAMDGLDSIWANMTALVEGFSKLNVSTGSQLKAMESELNLLNRSLIDLGQATDTDLEVLMTAIDELNESLMGHVAATDARLEELGARMSTTEEVMDGLNSSIAQLVTALEAIYGRMMNLEGNVSSLEEDMSTMEGDLEEEFVSGTDALRDDLGVLDDREARDHADQEAMMDDRYEEALDEATVARNTGVLVGAAGVILAVISLLAGARRGRAGTADAPEGS
jgi:uncharacterized coiled-coil protein SlyX